MEDIMLKIANVSKMYKLGQIGGTTLRDELQRMRAKHRGEEDPTKKIGSKDYNKGETFMALSGVSFEVKKGERVGIIGHNGAGKSTLLKLISRVTAPSGGTISMNGHVASMLEVGTGFHPELTGRENIYMNGAILGMTKKEIDAKMEDIIEFSECRQFIDTPVKRYSSGMYVKLAFSVAAHLDSEIMIMDEVLAVGDMAFQKKCLDKMNDVSKTQGRTILYVSHNMNTIRQLCDRVVVLDHGQVIFNGDVESGIDIYSGSFLKKQLSYEFPNPNVESRGSKEAEIIRIEFNNLAETGKYTRGKDIDFSITIKAKEDIDDIGIRFEIYAGGIIAGTSFLNKPFNISFNEDKTIRVVLPTNNFIPAQYSVVALLYEYDQYGNEMFLHRVEPAMCFEIEGNEEDLIWLPQYWGYTHYPDMKRQEE